MPNIDIQKLHKYAVTKTETATETWHMTFHSSHSHKLWLLLKHFSGLAIQHNPTAKTEILWSATSRRLHQLPQAPLRVGTDWSWRRQLQSET